MKGLELCKQFFYEFGEPMLKNQFSNIYDKLAIGLVGSGSECYGFDDDISQDHDFEAGFCIFIPDENIVDRKTAFNLERAYIKLPKEYKGIRKSLLSPVSRNRHGVIRISDFYIEKVGRSDGKLTAREWLTIEDSFLAEAVNGEIFFDNYGLFTEIRNRISEAPLDIRMKKLAGNLLLSAQSGQYNFKRCLEHGETAAAQLALFEFVKCTMKIIFILNKKYMPYYKWSFRALKELPLFGEFADSFEFLISSDNSIENSLTKTEVVNDICTLISAFLVENKLSSEEGDDIGKHAYSINDNISDSEIRNLNIFYAV